MVIRLKPHGATTLRDITRSYAESRNAEEGGLDASSFQGVCKELKVDASLVVSQSELASAASLTSGGGAD